MIYHRVKYNHKNLKKEDFIYGFGIDTTLLSEIQKKRKEKGLPTSDDYRELYDNREGFYISGKEIITKIHPYHSYDMYDTLTDKLYTIDTVNFNNYYGKYMIIGMREKGSKSHKHITYHNYTSFDNTIMESSVENLGRYKLVEKK